MHAFIGATAFGEVNFEGSGIIFLRGVMCSGNESRLIDCPAEPIGSTYCEGIEDAGVVCAITGELNVRANWFVFFFVICCCCLFACLFACILHMD